MLMILILLRLLIAVVAVFVILKRKQDPLQAWVGGGILMVLLAVTLTTQIVRSRRPVNTQVFRIAGLVNESSGYHLGQAIAADLPPNATLLVLHNDPSIELFDFMKKRVMRGVRSGLDERAYTWNFAYKAIPPDQRDDEELLIEASRLTPERLEEFLRAHPNTDAVLSLIGRPLVNSGQAEALKLPPFYVHVTHRDRNLEAQVQQGVVRAAVVYRQSPDWNTLPTTSMSLEDIFRLRYELLKRGH